jgi:hypothetical protein
VFDGTSFPKRRDPNLFRHGPALAIRSGVDCRIEVVRGATSVVVHLAGRLRHVQVSDFIEACIKAGAPLRVDLRELISTDAVGLDALLRVREMGATLEGVPIYLQLKIDSLARERRATPRSDC